MEKRRLPSESCAGSTVNTIDFNFLSLQQQVLRSIFTDYSIIPSICLIPVTCSECGVWHERAWSSVGPVGPMFIELHSGRLRGQKPNSRALPDSCDSPAMNIGLAVPMALKPEAWILWSQWNRFSFSHSKVLKFLSPLWTP